MPREILLIFYFKLREGEKMYFVNTLFFSHTRYSYDNDTCSLQFIPISVKLMFYFSKNEIFVTVPKSSGVSAQNEKYSGELTQKVKN